MSQTDLTSLSDKELTERWEEAMATENATVKAEEDYSQQAGGLAQGEMPVMSKGEAGRLANATELARQCRLVVEQCHLVQRVHADRSVT